MPSPSTSQQFPLEAKPEQAVQSAPMPDDFAFDPDETPIWELAAQISAQLPDAEWKQLPTDLARRFDNYQAQSQE